jgi:hypothetical protein
MRKMKQRLQAEFRDLLLDGLEVKIDTWGGVHSYVVILKCARRNRTELIVMGAHTAFKGQLQEFRWYVGSAVERVSAGAESECPVAVITDPKALEKPNGQTNICSSTS